MLTWAITEGLKVRLGISVSSQLRSEQKETLRLLASLGIDLIELQHETTRAPHVIAQLVSQAGVRSLYSSINTVGVPGSDWLQGDSDVVWATSKLMPAIVGNTIDYSEWNQHSQGARIVEVTTQLDGTVKTLKKRLLMLINEQMPELATLISNDQPVGIDYSDRYLKSPWSLMLLSGFLALFRSDQLQSLTVQTLAPSGSQPSYLFSHDWMRVDDQQAILELWLKSQFDIQPSINVMNRPRDLLHCRVITVSWASGKTSKILLDQGMGYWRVRVPSRDQMNFDFSAPHHNQAMQMLEKYPYVEMQQSGDWPTYISCIID